MTDDHYFDAGAGAWRTEGDDAWLGERAEDAPVDAPEWQDGSERLPEPEPDPATDKPGADKPEAEDDPMDDPDFRRAARGHREMSGDIVSHGRRRGNHPAGFKGNGIRGLRTGDGKKPPVSYIRPTGKRLGPRAPVAGRPGLDDAYDVIRAMLGRRRVAILRASLSRRGRATAKELEARAYLAVMLWALDDVHANRAAAELLETDMDRIGDLRRRSYDAADVAKAEEEMQKTALRLAGGAALIGGRAGQAR